MTAHNNGTAFSITIRRHIRPSSSVHMPSLHECLCWNCKNISRRGGVLIPWFLQAAPWSAIKDRLTPTHLLLLCFGLLRWCQNGLNLSIYPPWIWIYLSILLVRRQHISPTSCEICFSYRTETVTTTTVIRSKGDQHCRKRQQRSLLLSRFHP